MRFPHKKILLKKKLWVNNFTGNKALNDLLNETVQGDTRLDGNRPMSMEASDTLLQAAPPVVAEAITRDYSSLMKAIDKKKGK